MDQSIFISYSSDDKEFALKLANDLNARNVKVWLDQWEIRVGDSLVSKIGEGIKNATFFGIILTPTSVKKPWVQTELNSALVKELSTNKITVLPILRESCEIPTLLWGKKYADFREDYETGLNNLLKVFRPLIQLQNLPFNKVVEKKEKLKYVPSCITLVNGTVLVGVVAGISESRGSLGIDPLHSSPYSSHFPAMHPNRTKFWVEVDSSLIADMWELEAPFTEEYEFLVEDETKSKDVYYYSNWQNEQGWTPWHFYDETCNRLLELAKKENLTALVPTRDLAMMGARKYRYGKVIPNFYMPLYCDWWYINTLRSKSLNQHFDISYKESMDLFFQSEVGHDLIKIKGKLAKFANQEKEFFEMEDDKWNLITLVPSINRGQDLPFEDNIPVLFRSRSLFFSTDALSKIGLPFFVIGEFIQSSLKTKAKIFDSYVKARGAYFLGDGEEHGHK